MIAGPITLYLLAKHTNISLFESTFAGKLKFFTVNCIGFRSMPLLVNIAPKVAM